MCRDGQRMGSAWAVLRVARAGRALAGPCVWAARGRAQAVCRQCPGSVGSVRAVSWQCGQCPGSVPAVWAVCRQCPPWLWGRQGTAVRRQCGVRWGGSAPLPAQPTRGSCRQRPRSQHPPWAPLAAGSPPAQPLVLPEPGARPCVGPTGGGSRPLRGHRPLCERRRQVSHPRGDTLWASRIGRLVPAESGQRWGRRGHPTNRVPTNQEVGEQRGCKTLSCGVRGWRVCESNGTGSTVGPSQLCPSQYAEGSCSFVRTLLSLHYHRAPAPPRSTPLHPRSPHPRCPRRGGIIRRNHGNSTAPPAVGAAGWVEDTGAHGMQHPHPQLHRDMHSGLTE